MFLFSLATYPEVEFLDHIVALFLVFWGTSVSFSTAATLTFPPTVHEGFLFPTSSPTLVICGPFDDTKSAGCEAMSHWGFYLHFPDDSLMILASFHVLVGYRYVFFRKNVYSSPLPIFNQVACFFDVELYEFLYILDNNPLSDVYKHLLPFSRWIIELFVLVLCKIPLVFW